MDLTVTTLQNHGAELSPQYATMLDEIRSGFPAIVRATKNFNKTQSQFMDDMLTVSHPTELRNARQILAEINKSKMALDEAYFGIAKKRIEIKRKSLALRESTDLDTELLQVEIDELESQIQNTMGYVEGAVRKIRAYMTQYNHLLKALGKEEFTEADFEQDEERYHIMKMFEQALCAARSHGGMVDEGNQIYAHQIGINGTVMLYEVRQYIEIEEKLIHEGKTPLHEMTLKWLAVMARKYAGSAKRYAELKGMTLLDEGALHQ